MDQPVRVFHYNHFVFFDHRHQDVNVSGSSTERNGPRIFMPISACAGTDLDRKISRNPERLPGLSLYVLISTIT
jgi:hypothetical protein